MASKSLEVTPMLCFTPVGADVLTVTAFVVFELPDEEPEDTPLAS